MLKQFLLSLLLILSFTSSFAQAGFNMIQLGRWDNDSLPTLGGGQQFSALWGWTDERNGREYAILGGIDSTYFIDITTPWAPRLCDAKAGRVRGSVWREYKTYKNYCYAVADFGSSSLQIFDMSYLPDSVHTVYDHDSLIVRSHTIWIDGDRLYCNSVIDGRGNRHAVQVLSLENPEVPKLIGTLVPPFFDGVPLFVRCHDAFVRGDTLYCSGENAGLFIYNYQNPSNPVLIGAITDYPEKGYNHSSFLSDDGVVLVFTDENMGLGIKAYDVSRLNSMQLSAVFRTNPNAIAHNPYFLGRTLFMSAYEDGVWVWDMEEPTNPKVIAWYDTYPQNGTEYAGFYGCWGVYPDFPSGNIIASDMSNGLFILRLDKGVSIHQNPITTDALLFPNPGSKVFNLEWDALDHEVVEVEISDPKGRIVWNGQWLATPGRNYQKLIASDLNLSKGLHLLKMKGTKTHICKKFYHL